MGLSEVILVDSVDTHIVVNTSANQLIVDPQVDPVVVEVFAGTQGVPGPAPVLTFDPVVTGAAGSNASLITTGDNLSGYELAFTIPRGNTGATGPANTLTIGTVTTGSPGSSAASTITGVSPNQTLNLTIPRGDVGATGPAPNLTIGTVSTIAVGGSATASVTGTSPNYQLNIGIPTGATGAIPTINFGTITTGAPGTSASASWTGSNPYTLNLTIPRGDPGTGNVNSSGSLIVGNVAMWQSTGGNIQDAGFAASDVARRSTTNTFALAQTFSATVSVNNGGQGFNLLPGASNDHTYMAFYARSAAPTTRSGYFGYPNAAGQSLNLVNEISGGAIAIQTVGNGNINILAGTGAINATGNLFLSGNATVGSTSVAGYGLSVSANSSGSAGQQTTVSTSTGNAQIILGSTAAGTYDRTWSLYVGGGNMSGTGNGTGTAEGTFRILEAGTERLRLNRGGELYIAAGTTISGGILALNNATSNWINFGTVGAAAPTYTTRSAGTKIVLYSGVAGGSVDFGFGVESGALWSSVGISTNSFKWYGGTTLAATLTGAGALTLTGGVNYTGSLIASAGSIITAAGGNIELRANSGVIYFQNGTGATTYGYFNSVGVNVTGTGVFSSTVTSTGLLPTTLNTYHIGAAGNRWNTVYANTVDASTGFIGSGTGITNVVHTTGAESVAGIKTFSDHVAIAGGKYLALGSSGLAAPTYTTYSAGTKVILYDAITGAQAGYALGVETGNMWFGTNNASTGFKWYGGTANVMTLTGAGALSLVSSLTASNVYGVGATTGTTAIGAWTTGDANPRFIVAGSGALSWGPGTAAPDTSLSRSGVNALSTPATITASSFIGSGASLTGITIGQVSGVVPIAQIPTGTSGTTVALGNHNHAFSSLTDITLTSPVDGDRLRYNGTVWVNVAGIDGGSA